jgi:phosphonate transport system substrate-binding protein
MKKLLLVLVFQICIITNAYAQQFSFTAIPDENSARLISRFNKVAIYLTAELGVPVKYFPVKSYAASVAAFKNNQVQLAWFGGLSGVKARRAVPDSQAIAQGIEDQEFITYFIAHTSTGLALPKDFPTGIKGKTFTFGSKGSTSGRLMPEFFIREYFKQSPREVFKRVGFSGNHSKTLALVQAGSYRVGALNYKVWENELREGKVDLKKVKIIWKTPPYVDYNWTIRGDVETEYGKGFIEKVKKAIINMKDRSLLDSFPRSQFIEANNAMYEPILQTGLAIGIFDY